MACLSKIDLKLLLFLHFCAFVSLSMSHTCLKAVIVCARTVFMPDFELDKEKRDINFVGSINIDNFDCLLDGSIPGHAFYCKVSLRWERESCGGFEEKFWCHKIL